jgi:hypothetical protein
MPQLALQLNLLTVMRLLTVIRRARLQQAENLSKDSSTQIGQLNNLASLRPQRCLSHQLNLQSRLLIPTLEEQKTPPTLEEQKTPPTLEDQKTPPTLGEGLLIRPRRQSQKTLLAAPQLVRLRHR